MAKVIPMDPFVMWCCEDCPYSTKSRWALIAWMEAQEHARSLGHSLLPFCRPSRPIHDEVGWIPP